jgi:hypothetical protein
MFFTRIVIAIHRAHPLNETTTDSPPPLTAASRARLEAARPMNADEATVPVSPASSSGGLTFEDMPTILVQNEYEIGATQIAGLDQFCNKSSGLNDRKQRTRQPATFLVREDPGTSENMKEIPHRRSYSVESANIQ